MNLIEEVRAAPGCLAAVNKTARISGLLNGCK